MWELIKDWPWYERALFGMAVGLVVVGPWVVVSKRDIIIKPVEKTA